MPWVHVGFDKNLKNNSSPTDFKDRTMFGGPFTYNLIIATSSLALSIWSSEMSAPITFLDTTHKTALEQDVRVLITFSLLLQSWGIGSCMPKKLFYVLLIFVVRSTLLTMFCYSMFCLHSLVLLVKCINHYCHCIKILSQEWFWHLKTQACKLITFIVLWG